MTMDTLFQELRAARDSRGMSLDDIARQTLINVRFLTALEQGDTTILPAAYVRAFLRAYASCVGMDPTYAMQRFDGMPAGGTAHPKQQKQGAAPIQIPRSIEMVPPVHPPASGQSPEPEHSPASGQTAAARQRTASVQGDASDQVSAPRQHPASAQADASDQPSTPKRRAASAQADAREPTTVAKRRALSIPIEDSEQATASSMTSEMLQTTAPEQIFEPSQPSVPIEAPSHVQAPLQIETPVSVSAPSSDASEPGELPPFWSRPWVRSAATTVVVLGGIAIIAYFARQTNSSSSPKEIPFGKVLQENASRLSPPDATPRTVLPQAVSSHDSLVLRASTTDSVWVQIAVDALPPADYLFRPNVSRTWKARDRFTVTLGNAGGVSFRLNSRDLGRLGKPGAVLRNIELTRETLTSPVRTELQP